MDRTKRIVLVKLSGQFLADLAVCDDDLLSRGPIVILGVHRIKILRQLTQDL